MGDDCACDVRGHTRHGAQYLAIDSRRPPISQHPHAHPSRHQRAPIMLFSAFVVHIRDLPSQGWPPTARSSNTEGHPHACNRANNVLPRATAITTRPCFVLCLAHAPDPFDARAHALLGGMSWPAVRPPPFPSPSRPWRGLCQRYVLLFSESLGAPSSVFPTGRRPGKPTSCGEHITLCVLTQ